MRTDIIRSPVRAIALVDLAPEDFDADDAFITTMSVDWRKSLRGAPDKMKLGTLL